MARFRCTVCGYIHEGTQPPEFCPVCGVSSEFFEPLTDDEDQEVAPLTPPPDTPALDRRGSRPRWVIVGGGVAAVSAAESARQGNRTAEILLIHSEPLLPYNRLSLTRFVSGEVGRERLQLKPETFYLQHQIERIVAEARVIDRANKVLTLHDGRRVAYDRLVLAVGAHAFVPPIPGNRRDGVHVLRKLEDAEAIVARARPGTRAVCIGGGLLGLETAGALSRRGLKVTVLEAAPHLLPRQLTLSSSERLSNYLSDLGIEVRVGVSVTACGGDQSVYDVRLQGGETIPAELVTLAAGIRPNVALAQASGLHVNIGIVVDDTLTTSDELILAAGDCAEHAGRVHGLWFAARAQGRYAGSRLAGNSDNYVPRSPPVQLKVLELPIFSVGRFEPTESGDRVLEQADDRRLVRIVANGGRVVGGNLVGDTSFAQELTEAVDQAHPLADHPGLCAALARVQP